MTAPDDSSNLPVPVNPPESSPAQPPPLPPSNSSSSVPPGGAAPEGSPLPPLLSQPLTYREPGRGRQIGIRLLILVLAILVVAIPVGLFAGGYVRLPSINLASSPRPSTGAASGAPPSESQLPGASPSAMPLDVSNALRVAVVINQRLAVNGAGLKRQLARSSVNIGATAKILRAVATNANQAIDAVTRMSDWEASTSLRTSLLAYYKSVRSTATSGLDKTLTSQSGYRTAASREYNQLRKLGSIGKSISTLATTWNLALPTPAPAPTPIPTPAPSPSPSPSS